MLCLSHQFVIVVFFKQAVLVLEYQKYAICVFLKHPLTQINRLFIQSVLGCHMEQLPRTHTHTRVQHVIWSAVVERSDTRVPCNSQT